MKLGYELSYLALSDLENIWLYTAKQWSVQQANIYYKQIFDSIDEICRNPKIGKPIDEIKEGHRKMNVKSHIIIYKFSKTKIYIDRILHQKMDIKNRLEDE